MLKEVILIDTNEIKKEDRVYYVVYCYIPEMKAFNTVFVNQQTYNYINDLPSYEDISQITDFIFDRKSSNFKLTIKVNSI